MNVLAIILANVVLTMMSEQIASISQRKEQHSQVIQRTWGSIETLERKRENLLLHLELAKLAPLPAEQDLVLRENLARWTDTMTAEIPVISPQHLTQLMSLIDGAQQQSREHIDELFLNNLTLGEQIHGLEEQIAFYKNLAIFLQVMGLSLILTKDLLRKL